MGAAGCCTCACVWFTPPASHPCLRCRFILILGLVNPLDAGGNREHGGGNISVLVCSPSTTIDPELAAGISVLASVVGVLLLGYCAYVSWYGRYGLPRLQRVSRNMGTTSACCCCFLG